MFLKNKPSLLSDASVIRQETADRHNTAERVGGLLINLINAIDSSLSEIKNNTTGSDIAHQDISHLLPKDTFNSMFEWVPDETLAEGGYIRAKANFLGIGEITAYGDGTANGDPHEPTLLTALKDLSDVQINNLTAGQILVYRNGYWVNEDAPDSLDETALATYLSGHNYITSDALGAYLTKTSADSYYQPKGNYLTSHQSLSEYYTKDEVDSAFQPKGNYLTSHQSLANYYTKNEVNSAFQPKGNYITAHQDISHLLPKVAFDEMFELVTEDNGHKYIKAKFDFLGVGEITAMGYGDHAGSGSGSITTLTKVSDLLDVNVAGVANGMVLVYRNGYWVAETPQSGGIDTVQLASYLSQNNYVQQTVLADYVTKNTDQEISGAKTFTSELTKISKQLELRGVNNGTLRQRPNLLFHIPNIAYARFVLGDSGAVHLLKGGATDFNSYESLKVGSIIRNGGTSSQFLKADGSVDSNLYVLAKPEYTNTNMNAVASLGNSMGMAYLNETDTTVNPNGMTQWVHFINMSYVVAGQSANMWQTQIAVKPGTTDPWIRSREGGSVVGGTAWAAPWTRILTGSNYGNVLNDKYVKIDGSNGTMAGVNALVKLLGDATADILDTTKLITSDVTGDSGTLLYYRRPVTALWNYIKSKSDAQYVNTSGDMMTGVLYLGSTNAQIFADTTYGIWLQVGSTYVNYRGGELWKDNLHKYWNSLNDGSGSGLDADMLDGVHNGEVTAKLINYNNDGGVSGKVQFMQKSSGWNGWDAPSQNWFSVMKMCHGNGDTYYNRTLAFDFFSHRIYTGKMEGGTFAGWKTLAFTDGNVASASKLANTRYFWGNAFNGEANVNGNITPAAHNTYDCGSKANNWNAVRTRQLVCNQAHKLWIWQDTTNAIGFATSGVERMTIDSAGVVIIGTTTPVAGAKLHVQGNIYASGEITAGGTSDVRLKRNVMPIHNAIGLLKTLGGYYTFDYLPGAVEREHNGRIGLLYQNVGGHFADLMAFHRPDGYGALNYLKPDYINLIGAATLENAEEIARLKQRVAELEEELERRLRA